LGLVVENQGVAVVFEDENVTISGIAVDFEDGAVEK
jgi:hypothetical protein